MKTRCPGCETTFRVTPEQLKTRAGKVRCGQCQTVFNALDCLLEETPRPPLPAETPLPAAPRKILLAMPAIPETPPIAPVQASQTTDEPAPDELSGEHRSETPNEEPNEALTEDAAQALAKATGLIVPRDTSEIPGYSKWSEGVMSSRGLPQSGKSSRWPFTLTALLLILTLSGQLAFYFRSELAVTTPSLRPVLEMLSEALGADIPLPHHADLVSIETSDLQADPARSKLLVLQATLRNRAAYGQAYPLLELTLTDTQDNAIARRVFKPGEYLSPGDATGQAFAANADVAVRLWIEAKEISAAGYRLYVFYP